jgi:opacity protein-like surface antigen
MMKKITLSLASVIALSSLSFAGGNIAPIAPVPVPVVDEAFWYAGVALSYERVYATDSTWLDDHIATQDEIGALTLNVGYNINEYLAVEGRVSTSFTKEDYVETTNYSIFLKPYYKFIDDERTAEEEEDGFFTAYGLLGFGKVDLKGTNGANPAHPEDVGKTLDDDTVFQWGLGLSYTFVNRDEDESIENIHDGDITIYVEYVKLLSDAGIYSRLYGYDPKYYDELSQDEINVGVTYRF